MQKCALPLSLGLQVEEYLLVSSILTWMSLTCSSVISKHAASLTVDTAATTHTPATQLIIFLGSLESTVCRSSSNYPFVIYVSRNNNSHTVTQYLPLCLNRVPAKVLM